MLSNRAWAGLLQLRTSCSAADKTAAAPYLNPVLPLLQGVLCDNLLAANWSPQDLTRLAILGNSFSTYQERWSGPPNMRPKTVRPGRLLQLLEAGAVLELPVPDHKYHVASAFNDMSLHTFVAAAVAAGCTGLFSESSGSSAAAAGLGAT